MWVECGWLCIRVCMNKLKKIDMNRFLLIDK